MNGRPFVSRRQFYAGIDRRAGSGSVQYYRRTLEDARRRYDARRQVALRSSYVPVEKFHADRQRFEERVRRLQRAARERTARLNAIRNRRIARSRELSIAAKQRAYRAREAKANEWRRIRIELAQLQGKKIDPYVQRKYNRQHYNDALLNFNPLSVGK